MAIRNTALRQLCRFGVQCIVLNLVFALAAHAAGPLTVKEFAGAVKLKMDDRWLDPQVGMAVSIPAIVSTGTDGSIDLVQDGTTISIAANTALELLPGPDAGQFVKRVVQSKGSTFYDVAKREHDKLRVETPYLVAVIKGTQFNVTVEPESTSVALFEGRLQIEAPDVGDIVDLRAGHIAKRHKGDARISVLSMEDGEPVSRSTAEPAGTSGGHSGNPALPGGNNDIADIVVVAGDGNPGGGSDGNADPGTETHMEDGGDLSTPGSDGSVEVAGLETPLHFSPGIDLDDGDSSTELGIELGVADAGVGIDVSNDLNLGGGQSSLDVATDIGLGDIGVDVDAASAIDLAGGQLDLDVGAGIDVADIGADLDLGAGVDLAGGDIDLDIGTGIDVADIGADLGVGADADLGSGDIGIDLGAGLDVADTGLDLDAGADVGLGSGDIGIDLDAGLDVADTGLDLDAGADVDLGSGDIGIDLGAGADVADAGLDLDAGTDVGLDSGDVGIDLGAGIDVADTGLDVDADADVDLGSGGVDLGVGAGDLGLDVGVDAGLDGGGAGLDVDLDLGQLDGVTDVLGDLLGGGDADPPADDEEEEEPAPLLPDLGDLLGL